MLLTRYLYENFFDEVRNFLDKFLEDVTLSNDRYEKLMDRLSYHMKNTDKFAIYYSYKNIFNVLYKAVRLMGPEKIQTYKECIPSISGVLVFCQSDQLFVEKLLKENSDYMQYTINLEVLEDAIINNYSFKILKIIINELEKNLSTNEQMTELFCSKNILNKTLLFYVSGNCFNELLDYLKLKFNSYEKLELFLLHRDDDDQLFIHDGKCIESSIKWIKENMSEEFFNKFLECIYPSLIDKIEDESEFIFYIKLIDKPCHNLLLHAISSQFFETVENLLFTITSEAVEDVISESLTSGTTEIATKIIKFCANKFSANDLKFKFIDLGIEESYMLCSGRYQNYSQNLKEYVERIGLFCILLRVAYQRILDEFKETENFDEEEIDEDRYKSEVEDDLLDELELTKAYNEIKLNDILKELQVSNDMKHILNKIKIKKSEGYLMEILEDFLDSNLSTYFFNFTVFVQLCCVAFENKIKDTVRSTENNRVVAEDAIELVETVEMPAQPEDNIIQISDMDTRHNILIDQLCSAHQSELEKVKEESKIKEEDLLAQIKNLTTTNQSLLATVRFHKKIFKFVRIDQKGKRKSYSRVH